MRRAPAGFVPGEPLTVSLDAGPDSRVAGYAVEDQPPAGWVVSGVSDGGEFDVQAGKVKWGPFVDNTPRTLGYQVTPPRSTAGLARFTGVGSGDGVSSHTAGRQEVLEGCRLIVSNQGMPNQICVTIRGRPSASVVIETSSDLVSWTTWNTVSNVQDDLTIPISLRPDASRQFFRARLTE